jgi:hypothetical protein
MNKTTGYLSQQKFLKGISLNAMDVLLQAEDALFEARIY